MSVGTPVAAAVSKAPSIAQRLWRTFKLLTRILIYVPLTLLVLLALLLGTEIGSRISVGLASQFVPDLDLSYTSGSLNKELTLSHAAWSMDGIKVELEDLHLAWQPICLLQTQLCVNALTANKVDVKIDTEQLSAGNAPEPVLEDPPEANTELVLPFDITLDMAQLNAINVEVDDMRFSANQIDTAATWFTEGLNVKQLKSEGLLVFIPLSTETTTTANAPTGNVQSPQGASPTSPVDEWAMAHLPQVFMPFPVTVNSLILDNTLLQMGERKDHFSHAELQGSFRQYQLTLDHLVLEHTSGKADILGTLALEKDYPLSLNADFTLNQLPELPELTRQQLSLTLNDSLGQLRINALAKGDADFTLEGQITLKDPSMPYKARLQQARLQWPLQQAEYSVDNLSIDTQGTLETQEAKVSGNVLTPFHKVLAIETELLHRDTTLLVKQFKAKGEIGTLNIEGELDYAEAFAWKAKVILDSIKLQELNLPSTQTADKTSETDTATAATTPLPDSLISGKLQTTGKFDNSHWQVALTDTVLTGTMQGYPFDISGDVSVNDALHVSANGLNAQVLGSTLNLKGQANTRWDLEGELQVPDFSLWLPQASGQLQANINVTGDAKHPQVELSAQLADLIYQNIKLRESILKAYYKPLDEHEFAFSLKSKAFHLGSQALDTVTLGSKGNIQDQKLTLNANGDLGLELSIANHYDQKKSQLHTEINRLNLATPLGLWQLDKHINLSWDHNKHKGNITPFCLVTPNSQFCLNNQIVLGNTGDAQVSYAGNPGKLLIPILPSNMHWDGNASLLANLVWAAGRKPTADLTLDFSPGSLKLKRAKNREVTVNYQTLSLHSTLDAKRLVSSINFESEGVASWQSEITVNVTPDRALSGYANIKQINLQPLGEFFPQLNTVEGLFTSKLNFAGTLNDPAVSGNIALTQGAFALTANPTLINKIDMSMTLGGQQAELKGRWMMGDGLGRVTGDLRWPQGQFSGELAIKGDKLAVIQPPLALLDVSPDVTLAFNNQQLELKGVVDIPSGNIKIVQLAEGGVALSDDVIFDDSIAATQPKASPYAIVADLNINVGSNLRVDGMGLKGKLQGTLKLQQQAFRPPLLFGDIKVKEGNYKFMGQTLKIRTGEVQFVGPTSVPNLNIEAIREIKSEDLVAGVRVTGTPARPVVTLFSNPAKEQAEILSYIIKGSGFNNTNNEQNNSLMMGAALGLSSQVGGGGAINNIGSTATGIIEEFGFSNVQLDTNDEGRVAISGFIGEKLMVKYGVGVFNPGYEMTVRYYLLSQLYLETVSGTLGQSLDIYYNFNIK
ncbi:translocation/assembly module TamB domain-containing protein [Shewanella sp. CG12_big_fil_rev_8_21_14_0_65_47_15]|uniref:autotransporter assembly complex protein TamB n=1 Tax=Shewanella sp. CG12_big_fil_rev_8_21_14_0_65_47_15 TaxID=1975537 RepID=UPI0025FC3DB4|nr:translocation/assembly module TamB domain-containing protein [Shewanella sp. CG12_big_fil_rev_8_21_14_0_65_47_15]